MPKFFRVAREGKTVDGREISANHINEMAESYDPKIYGARIWLEHFRGLFPDSLFKALGDVTELKAEDDETGKRVLLASISPTADLIKMNQDRQKVFTSVEIKSNFSDSGKAYLTGLAVTDSPASTGTDMLKFSLEHKDQLPDSVKLPDSLFSESIETAFDFKDDSENEPGLFNKVKALFNKNSEDNSARFSDIESSVLAVAEEQQKLSSQLADSQKDATNLQALTDKFNALQTSHDDLVKKLKQESAPNNNGQRPPADGQKFSQSDC